MLMSSGGRSMMTFADRGRGVNLQKILLTSYVNALLLLIVCKVYSFLLKIS